MNASSNRMIVFCQIAFATAAVAFAVRAHKSSDAESTDSWPSYGHDLAGSRYSPLTQIDRTNVARLKPAWVFHTGEISDGRERRQRTGFETTPLVVDGTLYLTTPFSRVVALDPETGALHWTFDPKIDLTWDYGDGLINRGVATWLDEKRSTGQPCRRRIFEATLDARLIALDAATGHPCSDFGSAGEVSLRDIPNYERGRYHMTSPPLAIDGLVIVGSAINDNNRVDMPSGLVRAFDARSGTLRWTWDPLSAHKPGPAWKTGAANAWTMLAADPDRHLVFVPTGSASPDYYGGLRPGDDKWADSVVALRSQTGELAWGFQLVHHDLWDYDTASPPLLATIHRDGHNIPVVVEGNKTGFLYVLHRETGMPVFRVEERRVPQSDVPGETTSPTQPVPVSPAAVAPQRFSAEQAWGITEQDRKTCRNWIDGLRNQGLFTPPSVRGTLQMPGNVGGMNWSGYAFDPERNLLITNTNNVAAEVKLIPRSSF
ncbi:MAG: PQQ-binding-like beta-propeller repeat protein, partial [Acidobacteriaceae bacterium]|nr:PQQ-binding-like beta-propeller repeat protein [Acidobacteriaceae bacterium]